MGTYDTVRARCPQCGTPEEFQSKSGRCLLETYDLEEAPESVLRDVNRHGPATCTKCGMRFIVEAASRCAVAVMRIELRPEPALMAPAARLHDALIEIERACVGCGTRLMYACDDVSDGGEPHFEPVEHDTASFGHGHLCPPCTSAVKVFLRQRREQRIANYEAVARGHK